MAREAHFVLFRDRNHPRQEVGDALPVGVRIHWPGYRQRRVLFGVGVDKSAVSCAAATLRRLRSRHADEGQVVLHRRNSGARRVANHLADAVDLTIAIRLTPEQDRGTLAARDFARAERERNHVESESKRLHPLAQARQSFDGPGRIQRRRRQAAADVVDAEASENTQDRIRVTVLRTDLHPRAHRRSRRRLSRAGIRSCLRRDDGLGQSARSHATASQANELATMHRSTPLVSPRHVTPK